MEQADESLQDQISHSPALRYASSLGAAPTLAEALVSKLHGVYEIDSQPVTVGEHILQLTLSRPNRDQVFNEVAAAVQLLGYSVLEAEISEIVDEAVRGAVVGSIGGGAPGLKNWPVTQLMAPLPSAARTGRRPWVTRARRPKATTGSSAVGPDSGRCQGPVS